MPQVTPRGSGFAVFVAFRVRDMYVEGFVWDLRHYSGPWYAWQISELTDV